VAQSTARAGDPAEVTFAAASRWYGEGDDEYDRGIA
jgi:hypothetical protein